MSSEADHLKRLREQRIAREKARIEKLRELNLKKYNKVETSTLKPFITSIRQNKKRDASNTTNPNNFSQNNHVKNNFAVNGLTKKEITIPVMTNAASKDSYNKPSTAKNFTKAIKKPDEQLQTTSKTDLANRDRKIKDSVQKPETSRTVSNFVRKGFAPNAIQAKNCTKLKPDEKLHIIPKNSLAAGDCKIKDKKQNYQKPGTSGTQSNMRKSTVFNTGPQTMKPEERKSLAPRMPLSASKENPNRESVFERLYKPKVVAKEIENPIQKLRNDSNYLKNVIKDSALIFNKRHTIFDQRPKIKPPVRRSISAVHFKRISKSELPKRMQKRSSIGEKLDTVHLQDINEDEDVAQDKVVFSVKSERKRVKFLTPVPYNTPKPEELQTRLKSWLQKRGKSIDSYHHLQCFGITHLTQSQKMPFSLTIQNYFDDENKENVALDSDSDNDSYTDNMENNAEVKISDTNKWRRASYVSESVNETMDSITSPDVLNNDVDELLLGALNDLTELLKEGFDWEQCARWLRAIREKFPLAPEKASYWECRAALEERRGDLPASVQCWEEAIAKGTQQSVVEANLDQLLDKFIQLKISPNSKEQKRATDKLVDVKNVFKSTLIRFAVQQAKLRNSMQPGTPKYMVTPVRRSGRLSTHSCQRHTNVCSSIRQAADGALFVHNPTLVLTP